MLKQVTRLVTSLILRVGLRLRKKRHSGPDWEELPYSFEVDWFVELGPKVPDRQNARFYRDPHDFSHKDVSL
jgi:hypothetical protein